MFSLRRVTDKKSSPARRTAGPLDVRTADGIRTRNRSLVKKVLYPLSYSSTQREGKGKSTRPSSRRVNLCIDEKMLNFLNLSQKSKNLFR